MSTFEEIGALLGFAAFAGLAVLVFLTFQQARHVRRLRDWAGRAPERAAAQAEREAVGEDTVATGPEGPVAAEPAGGSSRFERMRAAFVVRWEELDRRMPFDPRLLLAGIAAVILGVGIATSGFGLIGADDGAAGETGKQDEAATELAPEDIKVAVLNGSAAPGGEGVPGLADRVSKDIENSGYKVASVENTDSFAASTVMFADGAKAEAKLLAADVDGLLGETPIEPMSADVEAAAGGADVALVVGQDDAGI